MQRKERDPEEIKSKLFSVSCAYSLVLPNAFAIFIAKNWLFFFPQNENIKDSFSSSTLSFNNKIARKILDEWIEYKWFIKNHKHAPQNSRGSVQESI